MVAPADAVSDSSTVTDSALLARLERFYGAVPRSSARTEELGPFTLVVSTGGWPYYARPGLGLEQGIRPHDVTRVRERQRTLGVPQALEWVHDTTPGLREAAVAAGLSVHACPLLPARLTRPGGET